jgi:hypothetical protein
MRRRLSMEHSATLISRLRLRLGTLSLLRSGGLALLLLLSILRRRSLFTYYSVHCGGRRVLFGIRRRSADRLTGVAGRRARASVLATGIAGTRVSRGNTQHYGATCENRMFHQYLSLPPSFDQ